MFPGNHIFLWLFRGVRTPFPPSRSAHAGPKNSISAGMRVLATVCKSPVGRCSHQWTVRTSLKKQFDARGPIASRVQSLPECFKET